MQGPIGCPVLTHSSLREMMMMGGRSTSRYPFTASQWQELEHQALIFKYIATGMPIPSELIIHMRRSYLLDSSLTTPTLGFATQPSMGWSCYQMGFGSRKPEDPEPGRCRRTDGKKWRCSKEAYGESKYCERHMHRGKNRSRKPVESTPSSSISSSSSSNPPHLSISQPDSSTHQLKYPYSTVGFQPLQNSTTHYHETPSYQNDQRDYRYCDGVKDAGEYSFLSPLGAERGSQWELRPLGMSSLGDEKEEEKHCYVLGADFKLSKPLKEEKERGEGQLRHFFGEWPQKEKDTWMDQTQLSISMPIPYHDFPVTSRYHHDD